MNITLNKPVDFSVLKVVENILDNVRTRNKVLVIFRHAYNMINISRKDKSDLYPAICHILTSSLYFSSCHALHNWPQQWSRALSPTLQGVKWNGDTAQMEYWAHIDMRLSWLINWLLFILFIILLHNMNILTCRSYLQYSLATTQQTDPIPAILDSSHDFTHFRKNCSALQNM